MSIPIVENNSRINFHLSFFFWVTVAMSFFIFAGFGLTYWKPMAAGTLAPLPPIVHVHGFLFSGWMILLMTQSLLINLKHVQLHRSLGTFGIAVGTGVLITGTLITLLFGGASDPETPNYYDLMYLSLMAVLSFGILFVLAIRQVRNPDNHRRLILFATIPLLPPGINRLYMVTMELNNLPVLATYLTMDALVAAIIFYDFRTLGKFSQAALIGTAIVVAQQLLHLPISNSDTFAGLCRFLSNLVYYR